MAPRIALVTGCSSGIGLHTAVALAKDAAGGYIVYATMRNLAKKASLEETAGDTLNKTLFILQLDVTSEDSIKKAVATIVDKHGRVDALVNNAGMGGVGFIELFTDEQMRQIFETNFFGLVKLSQEVIPLMKKQKSGRIVNVSSMAGFTGLPFVEIYSASKFAVEGFTQSLALTLRPFNIWVSSVQPGPVTTNFTQNMSANNQPTFETITEMDVDPESKAHFGKMMAPMFKEPFQTSEEVAAVIKGALEDKKPHLMYATSDFRREYAGKIFLDPTGDTFINSTLARAEEFKA